VALSAPVLLLVKRLKEQALHENTCFPVATRKGSQRHGSNVLCSLRQSEERHPRRVATAHGFNGSFRDWASANGYARDLAERALAHSVADKVEAAYHRTDLMEQRRPLIEAWGVHVCEN